MFSKDIDFAQGYVLPIDKPYRWTSTDVVRRVNKLLKQAGHKNVKVGHAGTLDPLATGLLLICVGKATKQAETLQCEEKEYVAEVELGATTPSYDLEHEVDERFPYEHITEQLVQEALATFVGEQEQTPPVYSAKQLDGKRAYQYARAGEEVAMRKALVTIYEASLLLFDLPRVIIRIRCSKGTYIRSIAYDLGRKLASGGHLTNLRRTRSGGYQVDKAYTVEQVEQAFGSSLKESEIENSKITLQK